MMAEEEIEAMKSIFCAPGEFTTVNNNGKHINCF